MFSLSLILLLLEFHRFSLKIHVTLSYAVFQRTLVALPLLSDMAREFAFEIQVLFFAADLYLSTFVSDIAVLSVFLSNLSKMNGILSARLLRACFCIILAFGSWNGPTRAALSKISSEVETQN